MSTGDTARRFGQLLQGYRAAAGLSQEELAERAGLSRRGISDLERGVRRAPHPSTARRLANALELAGEDRSELLAAQATASRLAVVSDRQAGNDGAGVHPMTSRAMVGSSVIGVWPQLHDLPTQLTSFVGREREVAEVRRLLHAARLVTLTGAGGVGKTRLALRVAQDLIAEFADGGLFVPLATITDPPLVTSTVAHLLGIRESSSRPLLEMLQDVLRQRHLLLVLDNFEQVLAAAPVVAVLLRSCPRLKVLVTSRAVLHISAEHTYAVPSLATPERHTQLTLEELTQYEAVQLFVVRAQAVKSGFSVSNETAPAVSEICARLDGLPLAIELAAARIRILTPQAILARLGQRPDLLVGGARDEPERHQTLRAAIAWSNNLLSEPERALFRRLSVFAGGWSLEAAEHACAGDEIRQEEVLDLLTSLVSKSLVLAEQQAGGAARFRMLETIRQFAADALVGAGEHDRYTLQAAEYYVALACEVEAVYESTLNHDRLTSLRLDWANFDAAWSCSGSFQRLRLAVALHMPRYLIEAKHIESRDRLLAALAAAPDAPAPLRAKALIHLAHAYILLGNAETAEAYLERSTQLGEAGKAIGAYFHAIRFHVAVQSGRMEHAADYADEALSHLERTDVPPFHRLVVLAYCGLIRASSGRLAEAYRLFTAALLLCQGPGTAHMRGYTLFLFGRAQAAAYHFKAAADTTDQALEALELTHDTSVILGALNLRGQVAEQLGDVSAARSSYVRALRLVRARGSPSFNTPWLFVGLAGVSVRSGQSYPALLFLAALHRYTQSSPTTPPRDVLVRSEQLARRPQAAPARRGLPACLVTGAEHGSGRARGFSHQAPEPPLRGEVGATPTVRLTDRQLAVLKLVAQGQSNREIARRPAAERENCRTPSGEPV